MHSPCGKAGNFVFPQGSELHLLLPSPPKNNICWCNWRMWLWLTSCPVPGWAGTHVSSTLTMSAEGSDAPKALAIGAFGRRCPSFLHICYQDSHRHSLNSKYIGNFFLHYIEECTQPGSYHIQKAFGKVGATESSLRAKRNVQLFLMLFPSLAICLFSRCRDRCRRLEICPQDYWAFAHVLGAKGKEIEMWPPGDKIGVGTSVAGARKNLHENCCSRYRIKDNSTTAVVYSPLLWLLTVFSTINWKYSGDGAFNKNAPS